MNLVAAQTVTLRPGEDGEVSALMQRPRDARALFILGPGAGAGIRHAFLNDLSNELVMRGIACLRYQFPYMERHGRRPDTPAVCHATIRAAIAWAGEAEPKLTLFAGGKSFGGRMTSQTQAAAPLVGVRGLAFVGFPLHPPHKPSLTRADYLSKVRVPMLFVQGTRDALAELPLITRAIEPLRDRAHMMTIDGADHAFHVPARSGRTDADVLCEIAGGLAGWMGSVLGQ